MRDPQYFLNLMIILEADILAKCEQSKNKTISLILIHFCSFSHSASTNIC